MAIKEVKVQLENLKPGMFVSRLDRPWAEAPYPLQGFYINSQDDIDNLLNYCDSVIVDVLRTAPPKEDKVKAPPTSAKKSDAAIKQGLINMKPKRYKEVTSRDEELVEARKSYQHLSDAAAEMLSNVAKNKKLEMPELKKAVSPMIDSVLRNPDAYAWLTRLKHADNYAYNHSICCAVWAVAFGRHLGMPRNDLQSLAIGGLLFDVGKVKLPENLINNPSRLNDDELKIVKKHVEYGLEILTKTEGINDDIYNMVKMHHERHNGSGYPNGLKGDQISIFARIAGLVDCYDALISDRAFASATSPHETVKLLYEWRDIDFQSELIEQFIQIVGIYPVGTIVELSSGVVGIILKQHRVWRLRPQIMLFLDKNKEQLEEFKTIDLFIQTVDEEDQPLDILRSVEPDKYGIDPKEFYI